jgi:hypothetical protein
MKFVDQTADFSKVGDFAPHHVVYDSKTGEFIFYDLTSNHKKVINKDGAWFEFETRNPSKLKPLNNPGKSYWDQFLADYDSKTATDIQARIKATRGGN